MTVICRSVCLSVFSLCCLSVFHQWPDLCHLSVSFSVGQSFLSCLTVFHQCLNLRSSYMSVNLLSLFFLWCLKAFHLCAWLYGCHLSASQLAERMSQCGRQERNEGIRDEGGREGEWKRRNGCFAVSVVHLCVWVRGCHLSVHLSSVFYVCG